MALSDGIVEYWPLTSNDLVGAIAATTLTATNFVYESSPVPSWKINNAAGGKLLTEALTLTPPFTIAAMFNPQSTGESAAVAYQLNTGNDSQFMLYRNANNRSAVRVRYGGTIEDATQGDVNSVTGDSTFHNMAGVFTSSTSRQAYLLDTLGTANTNSVTPTGSSKFLAIGQLWNGSTSYYASSENTRIKHVAIWSRALSDAELDSYFSDPSQVIPSVAPVLSAATVASVTATGATVGCSTDTASGTLYWYVSTSATPPSAANLKSGSGSAAYGNVSNPGTGTETFNVTGLTSGATYWAHFIHTDNSQDSSILTTTAPFYPATARPSSDVTTTNWSTSTGTSFYALIDEDPPGNDTDYVISPSITGTGQKLICGLTESRGAGKYHIPVRASVTVGSARLRVALLNDSNDMQGYDDITVSSSSPTRYVANFDTTGTATRISFEFVTI